MDHAVATAKGSTYIGYEDDDEEEDVCRICRDPGDADNPLRYPCACSGSIKFVHQGCLLQWLNYYKARRCEVCKHRFSFSPLYAEKAPTRLPFQEFVVGVAMKAFNSPVLRFFLRLSFVLSVWLLTVPFITFWIWRLAFLRCFGEAQRLFLSHISTTAILADCFLGFLLSASIVFICCQVTSLRNYFRHLRENVYVLVGMRSSVFRLVKNAFSVLASNMIFLGVVIFVPFTLGRVILYLLSWLFAAARGPAVTASVHFADTGPPLENITLHNVLTAVSNLTYKGQVNGLFGQLTQNGGSELNGAINTLSAAADFLKGSDAGSSKLYDVTTLTVGYMFIVFLVFLYLGIIALIRYFKDEPLTVGGVYGIASIVEPVSPLLRQFLAGMRLGIRVAFFSIFVFGVLPLMCGWFLDVCTARMFGKTISHRLQFLLISPLASSLVHWVVGIMFAWHLFIFENILREVLRPEVLFFLYDLEDEDEGLRYLIDEPVHKVTRDILLETAELGILIVLLVFLPVKLAILMAPSIFPLDIFVSDPFTEIPAGVLLFTICTPFIIEHFRLQSTIKSLLRCWFTGVGWVLGLTNLLLPRPEDNVGQDNGNGEPEMQNRAQVLQVGGPDRVMAALPAAADPNRSLFRAGNVNIDEEQSDSEYNFVIRIILLLLYAWVTLLLFNSALIVVPVSLGRALFSAIPMLPITHGIKCNDLYAFVIGTYAFWTTISGARYTIEHVKSNRTSVLFNQIWKWCGIVFKSSVLLAIWVFIIPVLIGLLFELLVIVPMRVPLDETPVFLLYQDWALGLVFFKIWTRLVMLDHMLPIVNDSWRAKFVRVREDGFSRLQGLWVLREIVFPIVMKLLTALCVPYVLARGVFPMLGYPLVVNSAVYRFAWIGCLSASLFCFCAKRCHLWFRNLHNSIRDDRYLIGWRLHNFGEAALTKPKPKQ